MGKRSREFIYLNLKGGLLADVMNIKIFTNFSVWLFNFSIFGKSNYEGMLFQVSLEGIYTFVFFKP